MKIYLLLIITHFSAMTYASDKPTTADAIFVNGNIYIGAVSSLDKDGVLSPHSLGYAQAFAVQDHRILAIGATREIEKLRGKNTRVTDLHGAFVMPGFNDAHAHLWSGGLEKLRINLVGTKSVQDMQQRIAARAQSAAPGEWLEGRGWDHTLWANQKLPTRQDLDGITGDHPAIFVRIDGHICVVNSAALKFAGITRATSDPLGGKIDRDANGEPTGILREKAKEDFQAKMPEPTLAQRRQAVELALQDAAESGVTSVQESPVNPEDPSEWQFFLIYEDLEREGKLTARISEWLPFDAPLDLLEQHRAHYPHTDLMLHTGMLKAYLDGSLGSRTAALLDPYSDDPGNSGILRYQQDQLNQMAQERAAAGFQIGFHAIGDRAVQMGLDAFAQAESYVREHNASGTKYDFRFRMEHDQVIEPAQFAQYRQLGVIASMQPNHLLTDMNWAEARIGAQRAKTSYPWHEFLQNGVPLAFGTDYPVEPITPFRGMYAAVTRKNGAGTKEYYPAQKLSMNEAIAAYTTGAAYAEFAEKDKGTLAAGMLADFVVLDRDLTKVPPEQILGAKVLRTVVGGKTIYELKR